MTKLITMVESAMKDVNKASVAIIPAEARPKHCCIRQGGQERRAGRRMLQIGHSVAVGER